MSTQKPRPEASSTASGEGAANTEPTAAPVRVLSPEAQRALAEAEARRAARDAALKEGPAEKGGQPGPDPVRYGDWEKGGIISDF